LIEFTGNPEGVEHDSITISVPLDPSRLGWLSTTKRSGGRSRHLTKLLDRHRGRYQQLSADSALGYPLGLSA
jgi:hypothetical protein